MNSIGQEIAEVLIGSDTAGNTYSFDLSRFLAGTYFVRSVYSDKALTKKISKL